MRYRLIPARGTGGSETFETENPTVLRIWADAMSAKLDMPVLVCEAPEGGLVRQLYVVGLKTQRTLRARR